MGKAVQKEVELEGGRQREGWGGGIAGACLCMRRRQVAVPESPLPHLPHTQAHRNREFTSLLE